MSNPLQFSVEFGRRDPNHRRDPQEPLRILYVTDLGDSTRSRSEAPIESRPMRALDVDAFEDFLSDEHPKLSLPQGDIGFREIDDFHPDQICRTLPIFQQLNDLRARLNVPSMFDKAAQEVQAMLNPRADTQGENTEPEDDTDTLSRLFGKPASSSSSPGNSTKSKTVLESMLHEAVAAHITADADPRAEQYIDAIDAARANHLRAVLHDPAFQSLEAAWRGLDFLVSQIETDEDLSIHVWNVAKSELIDALGAPDAAPETAPLHRRIVEDREGRPFTLIVTDMIFGSSSDDIRLLATLGAMAGRTNALVLVHIAPELIGAQSWTQLGSAPETLTDADAGWDTLRTTPMAQHIVALASRFLLRAPYGKKTDPIDALAFEEMSEPTNAQASLLWGAPTLLATLLIAQSFRGDGWDARLNQNLGINDLPLVPFDADGVSQIMPCGEALFPDRSVEALLKRGPVPVMAIRNQNAVRLPWFQTISDAKQTGMVGPFNA